MRPGIEVRSVRPEDLDGLVDLCLAARGESSVGPQLCSADRDSVAQQVGTLASVPDGTVLVALQGEEVVGFLLGRTVGPNLFTDTVGFSVEVVYVAADHRRRGTGHALMLQATSVAAAAGAEQVYVAPLPGARGMQRFLVRLGFGPAATHRVASTSSLQRRLSHEVATVRRAPRSLEELIARRRESRRRGRPGDADAAGLEAAATGTDGAAVSGRSPVGRAEPAVTPVRRVDPAARQRRSISTQVSRAVQTRRDLESSTTIS